jgi:hypothetical protein
MPSKTKLLDHTHLVLRLKHMSSCKDMGASEIRAFLAHLALCDQHGDALHPRAAARQERGCSSLDPR